MATYNGSHYIVEQIESIISQSYNDWQLIIRDDGSSDSTLEIIKKYMSKDNRIMLIEDSVICGSPEKNFMKLLSYSTAEFICFCDQDDIWLREKLTVMLECIENRNNSIPQLVFSDGYLYYNNKSGQLNRLLNARPKQLRDTLFCNGGIHGSLSMFNSAMRKEMLRNFQFIAMHDHLLTLIGCAHQTITYLEIPTFYYRQHCGNVTPHVAKNIFIRIFKTLTQNRALYVVDERYFRGVKSFYDEYRSELSCLDRRYIELYLDYPQKKMIDRFMSIMLNGFSLNNSKLNLLLKLLIKRYSNFS